MARQADCGVLLIHGMLGSPREFTPLEGILQAEGYRTRAVTQLGHGLNPTLSLQSVTAEALIEHCTQEYHRLADECEQVFVVGHSLGGMCSLILAGRAVPKLVGVTAFAAPYEHALFVNYPQGFFKLPGTHVLPALRYAPQVFTGFEKPVFYPWHYPHLYRETGRMLARLQESLPSVDVPVWLAHSPYDYAVPYAEMDKIAGAIGKPHLVRTHTLQRCGHQVFPYSDENENATCLVLDFLAAHRPAHRA